MFRFISWDSFFYTVVIIVGGYYIISALLLYHEEIVKFIKGGSQGKKSLEFSSPSNIMGSISNTDKSIDPRTDEVHADEINFGDGKDPAATEGLVVGAIADALEEIKTTFGVIVRDQLLRDDATAMLQKLLVRYNQLSGTPYQSAITQYIIEEANTLLPFDFKVEEVSRWWNQLHKNK